MLVGAAGTVARVLKSPAPPSPSSAAAFFAADLERLSNGSAAFVLSAFVDLEWG